MSERCITCGRVNRASNPRRARRRVTGYIDTAKGVLIAVEDVDSDLDQFNWNLHRQKYATRIVGRKHVLMHRIIMERCIGRELLPSEIVDHIDRDTTNNRRSNLRIVTHTMNLHNSGPRQKNKTGYKGVSMEKGSTYVAWISSPDKNLRLGTFQLPEEAAWLYDQWAIQLFGDHAFTNFEYV